MENFRVLSSSSLKMIAVITMFIDHLGFALVYHLPSVNQHYQICRDIGRIAFPIFCFLLVEGFLHTSSRKKYAMNLFAFSLLSELPYDLVFNANRSAWHSQNVFFTLFLGLMVLWGIEYFYGKIVFQGMVLSCGMLISYFIHCDYDWKGILLIALLYLCRHDALTMTAAGFACLYWEWKAIFAFLPINLYNGQRGWMKGKIAKYFFYVFYPLHLLLLVWLRHQLVGPSMPIF